MYNGIVQPRLDYAIAIWGFTSQQNIYNVQRLQNRAARIITGNHDYVHTRGLDIVKQLNWMNVVQRRDYFIALFMLKCIHGLSPVYLSDLITMSNDIAIRPTRASSSDMVMVPRVILYITKRSYSYCDPMIWNALPKFIKHCVSINIFRKALKTHVLQ